MNILIASNNKEKLRELKKMLPYTEVTLLTPNEVEINIDPDESGKTPEENARIKAEEFWAEIKEKELDIAAVVSDDTGIFVEAFLELIGEKANRWHKGTPMDRNKKLLEIMENEENRNIHYKTVLCYKDEEKCLFFEGFNHGVISTEIKEGTGYAYDYIFKLSDGRMISELTLDERDGMICRAVAARELSAYIKTKMDL
ncbi:MAG: hypothetical protein A2Y22_01575 [Clostridiales bacterium GWD2_32_59]|nr:MAG: hypothetical protein A2Y22_01575 [Clostridiales bacterium GWD2_32_59]